MKFTGSLDFSFKPLRLSIFHGCTKEEFETMSGLTETDKLIFKGVFFTRAFYGRNGWNTFDTFTVHNYLDLLYIVKKNSESNVNVNNYTPHWKREYIPETEDEKNARFITRLFKKEKV